MQLPDFLPALAGKAKALLAADSLTEANNAELQGILTQLERKFPDAGESLYLRGLFAHRQGQSTVALEFLEQATRKKPGLLDPHFALGEVLLKSGQVLGAETEARTGISLSLGSEGRFYTLLAHAYHDDGRLDSCSQVVEYALTRFPAEIELMVLDGMLQEYRGSFDLAEKNYRKALAMDPDNRLAAQALKTLGEKSPPGNQSGGHGAITPHEKAQTALDIIEPLATQYPDNEPLHYALGQAYLKARRFDLALVQFEGIQEKDPDYPDIQLRIQEAKAVSREPVQQANLTEELKRGIDSLRNTKSAERSFSERLGHYLVRWGASPKEFFGRYPIAGFKMIDSLVWQETIMEAQLEIKSTIVFRKDRGLSAVHVTIRDTTFHEDKHNVVYDLYGRILGQNSRISGMGVSTGDTQCDKLSFQGAVWESKDNFEVLAQFAPKRYEVRLLRLDPRQFETMPRLCGHMQRLMQY